LFICNHEVNPSQSSPLSTIPNPSTFRQLISIVDSSTICPGNPDARFVEMGKSRNDKFTAIDGETKASIESCFPLLLNGKVHTATERTDILIHGAKCDSCHDYHAQLRATYSKHKKDKPSKSKYVKGGEITTTGKGICS